MKEGRVFEEQDIVDIRIRKGMSFCQEERIRHIIHEMDAITFGNQKWNGAIPSLIKSLMSSIVNEI